MTFFCIADVDSAIGFKLAGIQTHEVLTRQDAREALQVALAMENVGVILITQRAAVLIADVLGERIYQHELPLILEIPSRGFAMKRVSMGEFLKEAIGVSV
ncbi:MAG: V-type ATP synthase subunit F [Candidatus Omnitrophota bacterium]